jgi:glycosyltransferase involved in cell wall biosynthesis
MPPTIGYDATAAVRQLAGIGRYTRQLLAALAGRDDDFLYRVVYCAGGTTPGGLPPLDARFRLYPIPLSDRITNAVWHRAHLPLPIQLVSGPIDLFHSPDFTLPPVLGRPTVLTIHDLAFLTVPDAAYPTLRTYLERTVPRSARRATHIIAVSENTRRDAIDLLDVPPDRITTVLEGVSNTFRPLDDRDAAQRYLAPLGVSPPFLLSVGTLEPRKNYLALLDAYHHLRSRGFEHRLVIAGRLGWLYEPIFQRVDALHLNRHVLFLQPNDDQLRALYGLADAFIYPSLYEGFALPPLEALACGTPTACSNRSSIPEVVGDAALLFDPVDPEQISAAAEHLLTDASLRARLVSCGLERARQFSWERAAAQTVDLYRAVLANA